MRPRTITQESTFNNHPIMTNKEKKQVCDIDILQEISNQIDYAEQTKRKTFCMRLDLRLPNTIQHTNNELFSKFQSAFMKNLSRQGLSPQYVAVREQSKEKHQHYHEELI